jgi:ribonuclease HI
MEVTAANRRTAYAEQACEAEVVADLGYLRRGMTEFPQRWRSNGWKAASGKPVLNQDLWWELAELAGYHRVTVKDFIRFAAEKARGRKRCLDAANVMKPCSEP